MASELAAWADATPPEAGRESSSRPVDLVHLSRYTLGDRALEREVLSFFVPSRQSISSVCVRPGLTRNGRTRPIR